MSRKPKGATGKDGKSANTKIGRDKLPPDPEGDNDQRATSATKAVKAYQKACQVETENAVADLLVDLMHLCDRVPRLGNFDAQLLRAYDNYEEETATDAEYARM